MPTMRNGAPSTSSVAPTAEDAAPKRRFHNRSLSTTTGSRCRSSPSSNTRPSAGATPITRKRLADVYAPCADSGSPDVIVTFDQPLLR